MNEKNREIPSNSTPIIHEIIEKLARVKATQYEFNIIMAVIRKTYGWGKKQDWISGSQLSAITGIPRENCHRTIKKLLKEKVLIRSGREIGINKKTELWNIQDRCIVSNETVSQQTLVSRQTVSSQTSNSVSSDTQLVSRETHTKETITKETIQKKKNNKKELTFNEEAQILARGLLDCILFNNSNYNYKKNTIEKWSEEIDRMMRLDKRTFEQTKAVIKFSQADSFWKTNILSAGSLRKNFDKLAIKMKQKNESKNSTQREVF